MKYANYGLAIRGTPGFTLNEQAVWTGGDINAFDGSWDFTVDHFVNAASILFNGAKMVATDFTFNQPDFVGRFAQKGLLFNVISSSVEYILANKSLRTIFVRVWEVAPKAEYSHNRTNQATIWTDNGTAYATTANNDALETVRNEWEDAVTADTSLNSRTISIGGFNPIPYQRINNTPMKSPSFMNKFKCAVVKEIRLEPGQFAKFKIRGPSDLKIDMSKYTHDNKYYNVQKFSRGFLFAAQLDTLAYDNTTAFGGFARGIGTAYNAGLLVEKKLRYKVEAPEATPAGNMKNVQVEDWVDNPAAGAAYEFTDEASIAQ